MERQIGGTESVVQVGEGSEGTMKGLLLRGRGIVAKHAVFNIFWPPDDTLQDRNRDQDEGDGR